jgi:uncharacterized protein HemX
MEFLVGITALLCVFGLPAGLVAMYMRQRHQQKMKALEGQASTGQVAALEAARADLEARVRTLETIVTAGDHDLETKLRMLTAAHAADRALPPAK